MPFNDHHITPCHVVAQQHQRRWQRPLTPGHWHLRPTLEALRVLGTKISRIPPSDVPFTKSKSSWFSIDRLSDVTCHDYLFCCVSCPLNGCHFSHTPSPLLLSLSPMLYPSQITSWLSFCNDWKWLAHHWWHRQFRVVVVFAGHRCLAASHPHQPYQAGPEMADQHSQQQAAVFERISCWCDVTFDRNEDETTYYFWSDWSEEDVRNYYCMLLWGTWLLKTRWMNVKKNLSMYYLCMMKTKINPWVYDKWYDTKQREHNLHVNKEVLLLNHVCIKDGIDDVLLPRYCKWLRT